MSCVWSEGNLCDVKLLNFFCSENLIFYFQIEMKNVSELKKKLRNKAENVLGIRNDDYSEF